MNLVIISTIAGVVPTMDNLKEGQLGANTADGKLYVNTGTRIKSMGGQHWKRDIPSESAVLTTASASFVTIVDVTGSEVLALELAMGAVQNANPMVAEMRITIDGEVQPIMTITGTTNSYVWKRFAGGTGALQDEPVYAATSLKVEMRKLSGGTDPRGNVYYTTGEYI